MIGALDSVLFLPPVACWDVPPCRPEAMTELHPSARVLTSPVSPPRPPVVSDGSFICTLTPSSTSSSLLLFFSSSVCSGFKLCSSCPNMSTVKPEKTQSCNEFLNDCKHTRPQVVTMFTFWGTFTSNIDVLFHP